MWVDWWRQRARKGERGAAQAGYVYFLHFRVTSYNICAGKKPLRGKRQDLPKPTELMKRREHDLELDKNLGKTMVVNNPGGRGPGQPGFYCETCQRNYKDSTGYLDHINSRARECRLGFWLRRILTNVFLPFNFPFPNPTPPYALLRTTHLL